MAASWLLAGRGVPVDFWHYRGSIFDAYRTPEILGALGFIFSLRAVLQNPDPLAQSGLVFSDPRVCGFLVWDPAAFYVQRKIVLGAGTAVRRHPVWPLCQPESFCRADGAAHPAGACHSNPRRGTARPIAFSDPIHLAAPGVHRPSSQSLRAEVLPERMGTRSIISNCSACQSRRWPTAATLFFALAMRTIALPAERGPAPRWPVSTLTATYLRVRFGDRKGYWERILTEACQSGMER